MIKVCLGVALTHDLRAYKGRDRVWRIVGEGGGGGGGWRQVDREGGGGSGWGK